MSDLMFPKIPKREYPETHERKGLTAKQKIALVEKQGKRCAICDCRPSKFDFDHITPLWSGGTNDPSNFRALCVPCHIQVTKTGTGDRATMNRKRDKTSQWARRERKKPWAKVTASGSVKVRQ